MNCFEANKAGDKVTETHFYQAPDKIHHMTMIAASSPTVYNSVLACQDKHVRVLAGSEELYRARVDGPVLSVLNYEPNLTKPAMDKNAAMKAASEGKQIMYGTDNGMNTSYCAACRLLSRRVCSLLTDICFLPFYCPYVTGIQVCSVNCSWTVTA